MIDVLGRRLPVAWDGLPVEWTPLELHHPPRICPPIPPDPCDGCGQVTRKLRAFGTITGTTTVVILGALPRLMLLRCIQCGHDIVGDGTNLWDLDDSDYGPEGSWDR